MEKKVKYIIRETPPYRMDTSFYFDCDCFSEAAGGFNYNLFILYSDRGRTCGLNDHVWFDIVNQADCILSEFMDLINGEYDHDAYGRTITFKSIMEDNGIEYNTTKCHKLKEWAKDADTSDVDDMAAFLSIITGRPWNTTCAMGYSQGDYVDIVYCEDHYSNPKEHGEIWLGACREFSVIDLDENGEEIDSVGGYFVADCLARDDEDYKRIVCDWHGIPEEETEIEMVDNYGYQMVCSYRTA